jgi:hypothetical protein
LVDIKALDSSEATDLKDICSGAISVIADHTKSIKMKERKSEIPQVEYEYGLMGDIPPYNSPRPG